MRGEEERSLHKQKKAWWGIADRGLCTSLRESLRERERETEIELELESELESEFELESAFEFPLTRRAERGSTVVDDVLQGGLEFKQGSCFRPNQQPWGRHT